MLWTVWGKKRRQWCLWGTREQRWSPPGAHSPLQTWGDPFCICWVLTIGLRATIALCLSGCLMHQGQMLSKDTSVGPGRGTLCSHLLERLPPLSSFPGMPGEASRWHLCLPSLPLCIDAFTCDWTEDSWQTPRKNYWSQMVTLPPPPLDYPWNLQTPPVSQKGKKWDYQIEMTYFVFKVKLSFSLHKCFTLVCDCQEHWVFIGIKY